MIYWRIDMSLLAILLFTGTMALSLWATMRVRQAYHKFSLLLASSGLTGAEAAGRILQKEGIYDVEIVEHDQALGDHYDSTHKRLVLSRENYYGTSAAALGRGPADLADFGFSRDGKPRNRQVQVGLVMINGWPIAHHVFDGSLRDCATRRCLKICRNVSGCGG